MSEDNKNKVNNIVSLDLNDARVFMPISEGEIYDSREGDYIDFTNQNDDGKIICNNSTNVF